MQSLIEEDLRERLNIDLDTDDLEAVLKRIDKQFDSKTSLQTKRLKCINDKKPDDASWLSYYKYMIKLCEKAKFSDIPTDEQLEDFLRRDEEQKNQMTANLAHQKKKESAHAILATEASPPQGEAPPKRPRSLE